MFQVAMFSVSSSFEEGTLALAILERRTLRPLAISGETVPWFMVIPLSGGTLQCTPRFRVFERPPDPAGRRGHVEMRHARLLQRVGHRVHDRRKRAAHAGLPDALGAQRVGRGRYRVLVDREAAHEARPRHRIVHEAPREELPALRVVYSLLAEHLARALGDAALHLPFDDLVIDDIAR